MTAALVISISGSGAAGVSADSPSAPSQNPAALTAPRVSAPEYLFEDAIATGSFVVAAKCPSARGAVSFYSRRLNEHRSKVGAGRIPSPGPLTTCPRYLAHVLQRKSRAWRLRAETYVERMKTLRDFSFSPGNHAWHKAVREVQRVFPGTESWLLSCSSAEGGHGRWVGYGGQGYSSWLRDSDTVGGPLQFRFSTFTGMYRRGVDYVVGRGFRVPRMDSTTAWRSALGQAIAGGWARFTGNDDSHWSASFGRGC